MSTQGNQIVNDLGQTVILRGANLIRYNWKWPSQTAMDLDFNVGDTFTRPVADGGWGANLFTIWIDSNPVNSGDAEYMTWIDGMVDVAIANGVYVMFSWHADNPHDGHPPQITNAGIDAMAALADLYKNTPNVIYAAQAEPGFFTSSVSEWIALRDRQEQTIDAIRAVHPQSLIGVSGTSWSQNVTWMIDNPVDRDNIFVKPHLYEGRNSGTTMEQTFLDSGTWDVSAIWPVVIGEFGVGGRSNEEDVQYLMNTADAEAMGWQAWNLSDEGPPLLLQDHATVTPTAYGQLVKDQLAVDPNPDPPGSGDPVTLPLRINAGGAEHVDAGGQTWRADQEFTAGSSWGYEASGGGAADHGVDVAGTSEDALFSTERWGMDAYRVVIADGEYDVRLLFAETYSGITGPGQRVFDVTIEGSTVLSSFDVYDDAGFATALVKEIPNVSVSGGQLDVTFTQVVESPMIKGIEVLAPSEPPADDPPPGDSGDDDVLFADGVLHWEDWSWGGTTMTENSWGLWVEHGAAWSGAAFRTADFVSDFASFDFVINPEGTDLAADLYVQAYLAGTSSAVLSVSPADYAEPVGNGRDYAVSIPYADLGLAPGDQVERFVVQTRVDNSAYTLNDVAVVFSSDPPSGQEIVVFADGVLHWEDWSWGGTTATEFSWGLWVEHGSAWTGAAFRTADFVSDFASFDFVINPEDTDLAADLYVQAFLAGASSPVVSVVPAEYAQPVGNGTDYVVSIPYADLGLAGGDEVERLVFQTRVDNSAYTLNDVQVVFP